MQPVHSIWIFIIEKFKDNELWYLYLLENQMNQAISSKQYKNLWLINWLIIGCL